MNNILVINNKLEDYSDEYVEIKKNNIIFKKNCDYSIYYENSDNINLKIKLLDNVYVKLFEYMNEKEVNIKTSYNINDNATLLLFKFYANDKVYEEVNINLDGYMSKIDYNFSNICINEEKYIFSINHNNSNSISNINNKSICLDNGGSILFDINTNLKEGAIKCNMNQDTRIVNLGENHSVIKPNMFIPLDDVVARHSSVIGTFNDDEIFYLMARGIDYNNAIKLLIKGYIFSNLIVDMDKRNKILNIINKYWR